jgi:hypothetical protein
MMDGKFDMKASILEKFIEKLMNGGFDGEEMAEEAKDPEAEMQVVSIEADPMKEKLG